MKNSAAYANEAYDESLFNDETIDCEKYINFINELYIQLAEEEHREAMNYINRKDGTEPLRAEPIV